MARRAAKKAKKKAELEVRQLQIVGGSQANPNLSLSQTGGNIVHPTGSSASQMGDSVDNPHKRGRHTDEEVQTYRPAWSILATERFATPAPEEAKNVAGEFFRAMILPSDRPTYDSTELVTACSELLGHMSLVCSFYLLRNIFAFFFFLVML